MAHFDPGNQGAPLGAVPHISGAFAVPKSATVAGAGAPRAMSADGALAARTGGTVAENSATITAGGADDTLTGGGYDTYKVGTGMGHAVVNNLNADGVTNANKLRADFAKAKPTPGIFRSPIFLPRIFRGAFYQRLTIFVANIKPAIAD